MLRLRRPSTFTTEPEETKKTYTRRISHISSEKRHSDTMQLVKEMASVGSTRHFDYEIRSSEYATEKPHVHICPKNSKRNIAKVFLTSANVPATIDALEIEYDKQIISSYKQLGLRRPEFGRAEKEEILSWANEIMELGVTNWAYAKATYPRIEGNSIRSKTVSYTHLTLPTKA